MLNPEKERHEGCLALCNCLDTLPLSINHSSSKKIRILHVLFYLGPGGVETWLLQVLRHLDWNRFDIDILVHSADRAVYTGQAMALGAKIHMCPYSSQPWDYTKRFFGFLKYQGGYDVIHEHLPLGGFHIFVARLAGIPMRIYHCHNDEHTRFGPAGLRRRFSLAVSHRFARRYATHGLAVSGITGRGAFGANWESDGRYQFFPAVNDFLSFERPVNRKDVRDELGLPASAFVMGHVGRFQLQKNHDFLIDIAAEIFRRLPEAYLVLVGDGPLRPAIENKAARLGLSPRVIFTGVRRDVARLMRGAMDLLLFPSAFEGMGMVILEAQAAGLPCVISDVIPDEATIIPELIKKVSLDNGPEVWAEAVLSARESGRGIGPDMAAEKIRGTLFDIETNVRRLQALYESAVV